MKIELGYQPNDFVLQCDSADTEKYKLLITNATLLVHVATLSTKMFREIMDRLNKENARMYLRKTEVTVKNIPKATSFFNDSLFPGGPLPSRIIIAFLPTNVYLGSYHTNAYDFRRLFDTASGLEEAEDQEEEDEEEEEEESDFEEDFERVSFSVYCIEVNLKLITIYIYFQVEEESQPGTSRRGSLIKRMKEKILPTGATGHPPRQTQPTEPEDAGGSKKKKRRVEKKRVRGGEDSCYIEKIRLLLNGESLDGMDFNATHRSDVCNFFRLNYKLGNTQSRGGNELSLDQFLNGYFFFVADLSTSNQAYLDWVIPAIKGGNLQIQVTFAKETSTEMTMLLYAEYSSLIQINRSLQLSMSY